MPDNSLKNKIALVTGASSGIGRGIAKRLYNEGMQVAVCARRLGKLEDLGDQLGADNSRFLAEKTDLRDRDQIADLFDALDQKWGGLDVLVNNAGIGKDASLVDGDPDDWAKMLDVNLLALSICTKYGIDQMQHRAGYGHVIQISSMSGHRIPGTAGGAMYSATKQGVRTLTEGLRREVHAKDLDIKVSSISPGFVESEFARRYHDTDEDIDRGIEVMTPEDIAEQVLFILRQPEHVQIHDVLSRPTNQES